jgi:multidrug resistance efflux pump
MMSKKKLIEDPLKIELRSEEVKEILSRPPSWLVRWGTSMFFVVIAVFLIVSWVLKYPEVVKSSKIVLTTQNPPALIVPRSNGPLVAMMVSDRQEVSQGDMLAVVENPADYKQVVELKTSLRALEGVQEEDWISKFQFIPDPRLGELQPDFASFMKSFTDLKHFYQLRFHEKRISSLRNEALGHLNHLEILIQQRELLKSQREISYKQFQRDSSLFAQSVISESDFERVRNELLKKDQELEQAGVNISSVEITLLQLEQSILQLELDYRNALNQLQLSFSESLEKLNGQISWWEQKYVLKANTAGIVGFSEYWSPGQQVREGVAVFVIVPEEEGELVGRVSLPMIRSGKVKPGQKVLVKLSSFPHMEYGMLSGKVVTVSLVPTQDQYVVEVIFPEGMRTNYGLELPFSQEMQGAAEIITEDLRLIQRILNPVRSVIQRNRTI